MKTNHTLIGVDLGGTNMRVGLIKEDKIVDLKTQLVRKEGSADDILEDLIKMIALVIKSDTTAIGIGVPSIVDVEKGIVYNVTNIPSWKEVHLKARLEAHFHLPVHVNNDANCFAMAEKIYGKGKPYGSFIGLILGTGFGSGVIIKDHLYEGRNCGAGEFGCISYLDNNYEYYCSGQFFINRYNTSAYDLFLRCQKGDPDALVIYHEFGMHVGKALQTIMYAYDPEAIIMAGSVSKAYEYFKEGMYESLKSFLFAKNVDKLKIEVSEVENIAIFGAASLHYNNLK